MGEDKNNNHNNQDPATTAFVALESDFCPPLDPALLFAIVSDYDLADPAGLKDVRATLDLLKESAVLEEQAGFFDASGTGGVPPPPAEKEEVEGGCGSSPLRAEENRPETSLSNSRETDMTSLSNGLSSLDLENEGGGGEGGMLSPAGMGAVEDLDEETKVQVLQDVFGAHVTKFAIRHTLAKCEGRWNATVEELLNHVYFGDVESGEKDGVIKAKSVDAFSEDNIVRHARKGKVKNKKARGGGPNRPGPSLSETAPSAYGSPDSARNKWKSASEDVEFISSRSGVPASVVSSVYYEKGASVRHTIGALLKSSMEETAQIETDDAVVAVHARELGRDFPGIAPEYLIALIRLTHPSTSAAHELAKALTTRSPTESGGGIQVIPQYARPQGIEDATITKPLRKPKSIPLSDSTVPDSTAAVATREAYVLARANALAQASAAHRRAKSDRLMGGVAAYYGQIGREYAALSSSADAALADNLAQSQSSANELDLHGIDVLNGTRIALEKVEEWWEGLEEGRANGRAGAEQRSAGFRIVVGLGKHSAGGKSKLGPSVSKRLMEEGWRVEAAGGVLVVRGPTAKR